MFLSIKNVIFICLMLGKMFLCFLLCFVFYKKLIVLIIVLSFLVVFEILWYVDLNLVGKSLVGIINVVVLGLKLLKKKINL